MTDNELSTLLRQDVARGEPPFTMSLDDTLRGGRTRLRVRRIGAGVVGAVLIAGLVAGIGVVADGMPSSGADRLSAASQEALDTYDPELMPGMIAVTVEGAIRAEQRDFHRTSVQALDAQSHPIRREHHWDKATTWLAEYQWNDEHELSVTLFHGRGEAEGDARAQCEQGLAAGYELTCAVDTLDDGTVITTRTWSAYREKGTDTLMGVAAGDDVDPSQLLFGRTVEAHRGGIYFTVATEMVKAPTIAEAEQRWEVPVVSLREIVLTPALVFPEPPTDPDTGCGWIVPRLSDSYDCNS